MGDGATPLQDGSLLQSRRTPDGAPASREGSTQQPKRNSLLPPTPLWVPGSRSPTPAQQPLMADPASASPTNHFPNASASLPKLTAAPAPPMSLSMTLPPQSSPSGARDPLPPDSNATGLSPRLPAANLSLGASRRHQTGAGIPRSLGESNSLPTLQRSERLGSATTGNYEGGSLRVGGESLLRQPSRQQQ